MKHQILYDGAYFISFEATKAKNLCICDDIFNENSILKNKELAQNANHCFIIKYNEVKNNYTIMALRSHLFLGVQIKSDSNYLFSNIQQHSLSNYFLTEWNINQNSDSYYSLELNYTNFVIEYNNQTDLPQLNIKSNSDYQKILIKPIQIIENGFYSISSKLHENYSISFQKEKNEFFLDKKEGKNQTFWVQFDPNDGCYSITDSCNDCCLSISESKIVQKAYSNDDSQKWILSFLNGQKNDFFIENKLNSMRLCTEKNNSNEFISLKLSPFKSNEDFLFHFQPIQFNDDKKEKEIEMLLEKIDEMKYKKMLTLGSDVTEVDDHMFENCVNLETLELSLSISKISENSFRNCKKIKTVICDPKWLKFLPNPLNIEKIIVSKGVESIDEDSFNSVFNLKFLSLPQSLKSIHSKSFSKIYDIKTFEGDPKFLKYINKLSLIDVVIPDYVIDIPEKAFCGCKNLKKVVFSDKCQLKTIQSYSFAYCESLEPFTIPESVNFISTDAFYGMSEKNLPIITNEKQKLSMIDNLIVDEKVTKITKDFCESYINIESLEIPLNIDECEDGALQSFLKLKYIKCNPKFLNNFQTKTIKIVFIPDGIKQLRKNDFENLINLKFIEIPESVDEIEENAFNNCKNLTTVKCGVKHLKFLNQKQIKTLVLNNEVNQINQGCFDELINLENLELPETIQINDKNLFINCKKLIKINNSTAENLINNKISIIEGTKTIEKDKFKDWVNLKFLEIPKTVENIEEGTFDDCININHLICDPKWFHLIKKDSIRKLTIPDFVTELYKGQFDDFYSLTQIELPNHIKINDPSIFDSCETLSIIKCDQSLYKNLSIKTRNHCFNNKKVDLIHPVYNFINFDTDQHLEETSIDDLAEFDKNNEKYCHSVMNIRGFTYSGVIQKDYKPENTSISEISKICGAICHEIHKKFNIIPKTSQYLAILRLADAILNNDDDGEIRGEIGKIAAGEGKTLIITILSIILAKYDRTVDIVISNLELAKRQQKEQDLYFNLFGIKTGILLNIENDKEFNFDVFKCPVVYSTIENFELSYLHSFLKMNLRERNFDVVLVDEVDKMFYDEFSSSMSIKNEINYAYSRDIFEIVYLLNNWKTTEIIKVLNYFFPNSGTFEEEIIQNLKNAALEVIKMTDKIDYSIENGQIISNTHFNDFIYKMIEIRENLETKQSFTPVFQINHHSYLNLYNKIAGVAGTIGSEEDEELLKKGYNLNTFTVLPHIFPHLKITTKTRPSKLSDLFDCIIQEIIEEREKGRSILVIWDSIDHVDEFLNSKSFLLTQRIDGKNPDLDSFAIENAGLPEAVTVATFDAVFGIDIKVSQDALNNGGLHVIVPLKLKNQRSIENAAGRSGRQGQPGSVTFYISENDMFVKPSDFPKSDKYLTKIEQNFANYLHSNFPWISSASNRNYFAKLLLPFDEKPSTLLDILIRHIILIIKAGKYDQFKDLMLEMVHLAWSKFFNSLLKKIDHDLDDQKFIEKSYEAFLKDLNVWFHPTESKTVKEAIEYIQSKLKTELDFDCIIFNGIKITENDVIPIFPENPPQTKLMNGILLTQGEEIYNKLQSGERINWNQVLSVFCNYPLINIIDEKWISTKTRNVENKEHFISEIKDENEEEEEEEIVTLKCQKQQDTWEWIFYNIKDKKKNPNKKKLLNATPEIPSFLTIEFIELALNLSGEAYHGDFSFGKVIHLCEENEMFKPVFYCLEESNNLYVVIRGSFSTNDWMTDFDCKEYKCDINGTNIYFHQGFYNSATYILNSISSLLKNNYETIFFIGHSYGASVSAILCLLTKSQEQLKDKKIYSLAFGSAPSMSFCPQEIENCIFTFINNNDLIPTFSLFNTLNTAAKNHLSFQVFVKLCLLILKPFNNKWIKELVYAIEQNFEIITDVIGILNVKKVKGIVFKIGEDKKKKLTDCIINDSMLPNTLSLSLTSLFNHFINEYEKSVKDIPS